MLYVMTIPPYAIVLILGADRVLSMSRAAIVPDPSRKPLKRSASDLSRYMLDIAVVIVTGLFLLIQD